MEVGKPEVTADLYSEPASHHQSENRVAHALLHTFGVWGIQGKLELLHRTVPPADRRPEHGVRGSILAWCGGRLPQ
jgi:hypothetical protein